MQSITAMFSMGPSELLIIGGVVSIVALLLFVFPSKKNE